MSFSPFLWLSLFPPVSRQYTEEKQVICSVSWCAGCGRTPLVLLINLESNKMKRICVYCGANPGRNPAYAEAAKTLGSALASNGIGLVYGGGGQGIMGAVADGVLAEKGEVIGIIPKDLMPKENPRKDLAELKIVDSMHERKSTMAKMADGFVALPGGLGTLEELFEVWTWAQLGFHRKPCALFNVSCYYDPLIDFLDQAVDEGFVKAKYRAMLIVEQEPMELISQLRSYRPPEVTRWLDRESL